MILMPSLNCNFNNNIISAFNNGNKSVNEAIMATTLEDGAFMGVAECTVMRII